VLIVACFIRNLVSLVEHEREWNFFQEKPILTTEVFPCDLDTTSVALTVTGRSKEVISSVMDEMLNYVDKDGIVQVSPRFNFNFNFNLFVPGANQQSLHSLR